MMRRTRRWMRFGPCHRRQHITARRIATRFAAQSPQAVAQQQECAKREFPRMIASVPTRNAPDPSQ
jgi:hypothetical protein